MESKIKNFLSHEWITALKDLENKRPLVQCITNQVTINECANALLALGASPVMADGIDAREMAEKAEALVINIGTFRLRECRAIEEAVVVAKRRHIPIILDPVGAGSTEKRTVFCQNLIRQYSIPMIKGNWSEIKAVFTGELKTKGVDCSGEEVCRKSLVTWSKENAIVIGVTGKIDWIVDSDRVMRILNGTPRLQQVTGTGCMSTALCGATVAVMEDPWLGLALGVLCVSLAGERAAAQLKTGEGSGTLKIRLLDELDHISRLKNMEGMKIDEI